MAQQSGNAPATNMIPFRNDREVLRALQDAAGEIDAWHELNPKKEGIVGHLLSTLHEIFLAILSGKTKKEIIQLTDTLAVKHAEFQDLLVAPPFEDVTLDGLKRVAGTIVNLRTELARARSRNAEEVESLLAQFRGAVESYKKVIGTAGTQMDFVDSLANRLQECRKDIVGKAEEGNRLIELCGTSIAAFQLPQPTIATDKVSLEISRRETWLSEANDLQERVEADLDETEATIVELGQEIKFGAHGGEAQARRKQLDASVARNKAFIEKLLASRQPVEKGLNDLMRYRRMVETVSAGVSGDVFSETLPDLPARPKEGVEIVETIEVAQPAPAKMEFGEERRNLLSKIAEAHALNEGIVFLCCLYELLPKRGERNGLRGVASILTTAKSCGLFDLFGWESHKEILDDCTKKDADAIARFLRYQGTPFGASPVYMRNDESLPWNVSDLFTREGISRFRSGLSAKR